MAGRTFAGWVEPVAAKAAQSRAELVAYARALPPEAWSRPSPNEGWSCKDVLAHVAGDKGYIMILRAAVDRTRLDPALFAEGEGTRANARDVQERRDRSIDELVAEIESDAEVRLDLMSRLTDGDRDLRQKEFPLSLGEVLEAGPGGHDREHLEQIKEAIEMKT